MTNAVTVTIDQHFAWLFGWQLRLVEAIGVTS